MTKLQAMHIVDAYDAYTAEPWEEQSQVYLKVEADQAIADLEESHKMEVEQLLTKIVELKLDYKEACDRLQTANLIKDEQIAAARHHKYKRCLAKKDECKIRSTRYQDLWEKWRKTEYDTSGSYYKDYIKWWHRAMKWLDLAEKFKEAK